MTSCGLEEGITKCWKKYIINLIICDVYNRFYYLVIAKVRERLAVGKQATQSLDRHRFNLSKLNELEVRKEYQIEITNRFAALETLNEDEDVNRIWGNIKHNIQI